MQDWEFQPHIIKKCEPPELPNTLKELAELLEEISARLKILEHGEIMHYGTTGECSVVLECPFCKSQFTGQHSEGCFHSTNLPMICPICKFPNNVLGKFHELWIKKEKGEPQ